jgi:hypothetical protein
MSQTARRVAFMLLAIVIVAAVVGYRWRDSPPDDTAAPVASRPPSLFDSLFDTVCLVRGRCDDAYSNAPLADGVTRTGIKACGDAGQLLFGWWPLDDADTRSFEWTALIPAGGVFPSLGSLAVPVGCAKPRKSYPFAMVTVAFDLTGVDWAKPDGDDVFIPFQGESIVDHEFHATATFEAHEDGARPRARIVAGAPGGLQTLDAETGDPFAWGHHRASVVRIVEPHYDELEPIGWVEVKLSEPKPDAGGLR